MLRRSIFLNELSANTPFDTPDDAMSGMEVFVKTISKAEGAGLTGGIAYVDDLRMLQLSSNPHKYHVYDWLKDESIDETLRNRFLISATSAPCPYDYSYARVCKPDEEIEVQYKGAQATALGFALLADGLSSSFNPDSWGHPFIDVDVIKLTCSPVEKLEELSGRTRHAATPDHVFDHIDWIIEHLADRPQSGDNIWEMRDDAFDEVIFCPSLEAQLTYFNGKVADVYKIEMILRDLCNVAYSWKAGAFPENDLKYKVSGEGKVAQQDPKCVAQRTADCGARGSHVFTRHIRINKGDRLYFEAFAPKEIYIGYVGVHPKSKRYK